MNASFIDHRKQKPCRELHCRPIRTPPIGKFERMSNRSSQVYKQLAALMNLNIRTSDFNKTQSDYIKPKVQENN